MTQPTPQPAKIAAAYSTSAEATLAGQRVDALAQTGHGWMPPDMTATLANSDAPNPEMLAIADSIKQAMKSTWNGFSDALDDPVLHKQPSAALALSRYLTASLGPLPVTESDLHGVQRNLQKAGYGADLAVNGVWDGGWNSAYNEWASDLRARQLAGAKPASVSTSHAAHSVLSWLNPVNAFDAIVGFAKAIPGEARSLAADTISGVINTPHAIEQGVTGQGNPLLNLAETIPGAGAIAGAFDRNQSQTAANVGAKIESLGRQKGQLTPEQFEQMHGLARTVQDVGLLLNLVPVAGEATAAAKIARLELERGITTEAASRGPGVIAKSLAGGRTTAQIARDEATGTVTRTGLPNSQLLRNLPLLRQIGPHVGPLADADGLYYRARTLLAAPYKYPAVRIAGREFQNANLYGAGLQAQAAAADATGVDNPMTHAIQQEHVLDTVDANLRRIDGTPFGHHFSIGIGDLAFVLHGPLGGAGAISERVGDKTQALVDTMSNAAGRIGIHGAFELATNKSLDELRATFGSDEHLDRFIASKTAELAAAHHVQRALNNEGLQYGTAEYRDRAGDLANEVWSDPALHAQAVKELTADPYEFKARIQADMLDSQLKSDGALRDAKSFMQAGGILSDKVIRSGLATHMFGGEGQALIRTAQDAFDYGGQAATVLPRTFEMTRREYTQTVQRLGNSVAQQLAAAQRSLADDLQQAEQRAQDARGTAQASSAAQTLRQAQNRQEAFTAALDGRGDVDKIAAVVDRTGQGPTGYMRSQWQRLGGDLRQLRRLVAPALGEDQSFNTLDFITNRPDPHVLYDAINGPPRAIPHEIGSGDWMRQHLATEPGALGLGRVDSKSAQQAAVDTANFHRALDAAQTPERTNQVTERIKDYLHVHFGMDARSLSLWDDEPHALLDQIEKRAHNLASEVFVTADAPPELRAALAEIKTLGYRPMLGTHIGHVWDGSLPPMEDLDGALTRRRKIIHALGVNPDQITSRSAGADARMRMMSEMQRAVTEDSRIKLPPRATAATVMAVANEILEPELPWASNLAFNAARLMHRPGIKALQEQRGLADKAEALKQYKAEIARALQLRDIPRKQWIRVMTTPAEGETANGGRWTWDGMDKQSANLLYRAALRGYSQRGAAMMGWQAIEDWGRAGFGFLDNIARRTPGSDTIQALANVPNEYAQLRNRLRFDLSPMFDLRRVSKQNYKMSLEGVPPVFNPLGRMVDTGSFDEAHAILNRVLGHENTAAYDDADRYLHQQSVWGLYNSRHYEAYFAHALAQEGKTDDEIRAGINKVFAYGSARTGGRSALERTANTVFFPFSFEKTLLRNTGAYLLDHPGQAIILSAAINNYVQANQHNKITDWVHDHLPILKDMQKLNAFAHGISPGEFGGINAPLLNLFLPQAWGPQTNTSNLQRFLPVWKDFGQLWKDTIEQGRIGKNTALNVVDYMAGNKQGPLDPYRPTITADAQRRKAYALRNQTIVAWASVLDHNARQSDPAAKYTFPDDPRLPYTVRGQAVNRTTIGYLVKKWYPAYDPAQARAYAQQQAVKTDEWLAKEQQADPTHAQSYAVFVKLADTVIRRIEAGDYDTATAAQTMQQFRDAAIAGSQADPKFYAFYRRTFQWAFGPLEQVTTLPS